jgi:radical SAM protein with 4Fe4S-binding SPASM domain
LRSAAGSGRRHTGRPPLQCGTQCVLHIVLRRSVPCVQFPLPSGNLRRQKVVDIWRDSPQLQEVRSITARQLPTCSTCSHVGTCSRCPGLTYQEGNMRGPSRIAKNPTYARV